MKKRLLKRHILFLLLLISYGSLFSQEYQVTFGIENRPESLDSISILNESTKEQVTIHGTDTLFLVYVDTTKPEDPEDPEDPEVFAAFEDYKRRLIENLKNGGN